MSNSQEPVVIGYDISTRCIGVTIMDLDGHLKDIFHILMPKTSKKNGEIDIYDKISYFSDIMKQKVLGKYNVKHVYIEAPLENAQSIKTVVLLAKFNGMISQKVIDLFGVKPTHHTVHDCRKAFFPEYVKKVKRKGEIVEQLSIPTNLDKKKVVLEKVNKLAPYITWCRDKNLLLKEESYDMADSYVVAITGLFYDKYISKIK